MPVSERERDSKRWKRVFGLVLRQHVECGRHGPVKQRIGRAEPESTHSRRAHGRLPLVTGRGAGLPRRSRGDKSVVVALWIAGVICGCGDRTGAPSSATGNPRSKQSPAEPVTANTGQRQSTQESSAEGGGSKNSPDHSKSASHSRKKSNGKSGAHIGEIPRDVWPEVFFDEPLKVWKEATLVESPDAAKKKAEQPEQDDPAPVAELLPPPPDSESDWAALLSGEDLNNETLAIRSSLTAKLQSVGKYSGNYKELRVDAATLAALAGIAGEHPDPPGWKRNAHYVRDVAGELVRTAAANGEKFYRPSRAAFDKLDALLSGSQPPDLEESAEKIPFSEVVTRIPLMYRMERAFNYLKLTVNTEALLKKEEAKVAHEGSILASLAKVIATTGYVDADLDDYRKFASELQSCGTEVRLAARNGDFPAYIAALDRGNKACTQCHDNFKNN